MNKIALIASLASALSLGAAAAAQESDEVTFAFDLDRSALSTNAGVERVYRDLIVEARRACTPDTPVLVNRVPDRTCVAQLVDTTVRSADSAQLAVHHQDERERVLAELQNN